MPVFSYRALDARGRTRSGVIDADSASAARDKLKRMGLFPTKVSQERAKEERKVRLFGREIALGEVLGRVKLTDLAISTSQIATLLNSGVPLVQALTAAIDQTDSLPLKKVLTQVRDRVNEGSSLANALREHPRVFDDLYINMVHAGEQGGTLEIVLERLADFIDKRIELRNQIIATLTYPMILAVVSLGVVTFLVAFVIPRVSRIFQGLNLALPAITKLVLTISYFMRDYWWLLFGTLVIIVIVLRQYLKTERGRRTFDRIVMKTPVFGKL
ncbi:MAG TPA: type II secretion system protein GspF, partial [Proteobacteria bacterium]|nr:type II secretion system protein GspF [Pseudomonadota bacterium]